MSRALIGLLIGTLGGSSLSIQGDRVVPATLPTAVAPSRSPAPASAEAVLVDWKMLNELNLDTGKPSAALKALDGKLVKIAAFIVPLEDDLQEADEFLLVPYF